MNKCLASKDGRCKNVWAFNAKCDGYSQKCRLKPVYDNMEKTTKGIEKALRRAYGTKERIDREKTHESTQVPERLQNLYGVYRSRYGRGEAACED